MNILNIKSRHSRQAMYRLQYVSSSSLGRMNGVARSAYALYKAHQHHIWHCSVYVMMCSILKLIFCRNLNVKGNLLLLVSRAFFIACLYELHFVVIRVYVLLFSQQYIISINTFKIFIHRVLLLLLLSAHHRSYTLYK